MNLYLASCAKRMTTFNLRKQLDYDSPSMNVDMVIIKGTGDKAFCAGGDVRAIIESVQQEGLESDIALNFFKDEYRLNYKIGTYKIPYLAFITGITMGGGVGLSVHGTFRIATETTVFAMPETHLGLFPDVGGGYFLPRLNGKLGYFLALTGFRLKGLDVVGAGVGTHFVHSSKLKDLEKELLMMDPSSSKITKESIGNILDKYHQHSISELPDEKKQFCVSAIELEKIDRIFDVDAIELLLEGLERDNSEWAKKQIKVLSTASPMSLKVTLRQLIEGSRMTLKEDLEMEYRLAQRFCADNDFAEGVRSILIDKDNKPVWKPSTLADISDKTLDYYFSKLTTNKELVL